MTMEDSRIFANTYYINRPVKSNYSTTKRKFWIFLVLFVMFALLAGVVLLVIFVMPKHRPPAHAISLMEEYEKLLTRTTMSPLLPKKDQDIHPSPLDPIIPIDPRSNLPEEIVTSNDTSTEVEGNNSTLDDIINLEEEEKEEAEKGQRSNNKYLWSWSSSKSNLKSSHSLLTDLKELVHNNKSNAPIIN